MNNKNLLIKKGYRISILTEKLIRIELQEDNLFVDEPTQCVVCRDFDDVEYSYEENKGSFEIKTKSLLLSAPLKLAKLEDIVISVFDKEGEVIGTWKDNRKPNTLKGTARTLDNADGEVELSEGIISREGFGILDDSNTPIITEDFFRPRENEGKDIYFFGYGHCYLEALKDFYKLCGKTPMIPRYMLGNWWSRFHKYTEESYMELVDRFEKEDIPVSVAVIDMDWHITEVDPQYESGWTGYTWNKNYFPNPKRFLGKLHDKGLHTTLNLHPAQGIRAFEDCYAEMSRAMGVENGDTIPFDMADKSYVDNYFKYVIKPLEDEGVDFWWIDWQQGTTSKYDGVDPLWLLNHFHYKDSAKNNKRPVIFSRYSGPGSHRYPIGFSGDTVVTWESLKFQPFFTATASNIGYGWWSHDICGHMCGYKSNDLMIRWLQFGVFSPIMRLHSSGNPFFVKEPWNLPMQYELIMKKFMQLRQRMIPYLYSMDYRSYANDEPLVKPLYYYYPEESEAYNHPNEYFFGTECIVAPITEPLDENLMMSKTSVWLPEGKWVDFFTGKTYNGGKTIEMFRPQDSIPFLIKAGGIIPMCDDLSEEVHIKNPSVIDIYVCAGADGHFHLYEDDGESDNYKKEEFAITCITYDDAEERVIVHDTEGDNKLIPSDRKYKVHVIGKEEKDNLIEAFRILERAQISYNMKETVYNHIKENGFENLTSLHVSTNLINALLEIPT